MLTQDQIANYSDRALMLAIYKDFSSRLDTLQSTMTNGISNLSTAVQTIAKTLGDVMSKEDDALAAINAQAPLIAAWKTATDALIAFAAAMPGQIAAAVAAAQADDDAKAQSIIDAVTTQSATATSEAAAAAAAVPAAPPPAAPASPAP